MLARLLIATQGRYPVGFKGRSVFRGCDVLTLAAKSGRVQCVRLLVEQWDAQVYYQLIVRLIAHRVGRCQINSVDNFGSTPLIHATMRGGATMGYLSSC